jgi:hypothetical protein
MSKEDKPNIPELTEIINALEKNSTENPILQSRDPNVRYCPIHRRKTGDGEIIVMGPDQVVCEYYISDSSGKHESYSTCMITKEIIDDKLTSFCLFSGYSSERNYRGKAIRLVKEDEDKRSRKKKKILILK